jgi:hypothetical protein
MTTDKMDQSIPDSISYHDDSEEVQVILQDMQRFQFTGMERLGSDTDDSWEVESYAVDSMELTKLRMPHMTTSYEDDDDGMASSVGSAPRFIVLDEDDWTVKSDCNDSVELSQNRFEPTHEQPNKVRPVLARINRRRASLGDIVKEGQGLVAPVVRRFSLSSVYTVEESLASETSGDSNDPAGKRASVPRRKSMPIKTTSMDPRPLWSAEMAAPTNKMERRVSNSGRPCAA